MGDSDLRVIRADGVSRFEYPAGFNVAVPFIDRHLQEGRGGKIAIRTNHGETVSYAALAGNVNRCAHALQAMGLSRGDRVLMIVKDCPQFFYAFWGAIKAGYVPVPVNTLLRAHDYAYIIQDSACALLLYSAEFAGEVEPALEQLATPPAQVLRVSGDGDTLDARLASADDGFVALPASPTDECFWLYSSGSTGKPKGAVHLHRDMVVTSQCYGVDTLGVREDDVCFSAAKLFFAYGLGNGMSFPLWVGGTAVLYDARPTPQTTFATVREFRPSLYFGVPTLYAAQLQAMESTDFDFSSVRLCVSAGEALPADIYRRWKERTGTDILDGIGSTEALHIFISNRVDDIHPGTSGRIVPGYEARILDERGQEVADGDSGQLMIRGDSTASHYWNNPEKTAATMVDGWLNTGDTYFRDDQGYYHYCGRNDDMLKVGGIWCSPFEIEARLIEHDDVLEAAVVGRADADDLVKPAAFVVLKPNVPDDADTDQALRDHCRGGLAPYKYPRWIEFVDELPKTATGKIQRFKLRQQFAG